MKVRDPNVKQERPHWFGKATLFDQMAARTSPQKAKADAAYWSYLMEPNRVRKEKRK